MATATKKVGAAKSPPSTVRIGPDVAPLEFLIYQDNGADYHWEIIDDAGRRLAHSGRFPSRDDAEHAARHVYEGAQSARFDVAAV